jgi:hypothetical protein
MLNERHLKKIASHCERAKKKRKRVLVKSKAKMKIWFSHERYEKYMLVA